MSGGVIDGIDEGVARIALDGGGTCSLPARLLPPGVGEGDRVTLSLAADAEGTARARARVGEKRRALSADDDGGDIEL